MRVRLTPLEATALGFEVKKGYASGNARYTVNEAFIHHRENGQEAKIIHLF